jgi:hypothetical protein
MAPKFVDLVESGETNEEEIEFIVQEHINKFSTI